MPGALAQVTTIDGLFKKYQKVPDAQYVKMNKKELIAQIDSVDSEEEKEMLRNAKEMRILFFSEDEENSTKLTEELNSLKKLFMRRGLSFCELPGMLKGYEGCCDCY